MRSHPSDVHREVLRRRVGAHSSAPVWYAVWLGEPHADGSVLLGRTERLPRARHWRVHPVTGEYPQVRRGWLTAVQFLLETRAGHEKAADDVTGTDDGYVGIDLSHCAILR